MLDFLRRSRRVFLNDARAHGTSLTLAHARRAETRVRKSRFIATAGPAPDEPAARAAVAAARAEFPDATHHCWAWRGSAPDGAERAHDAGEPAGTAGTPILQAIRGAGLSAVVVVVTRYFGGVRLGKGGLARAYREAARAALAGAATIAATPEVERALRVAVAHDGPVRHLLARHEARVVGAAYGEGVVDLVVRLPAAAEAALASDLEALTRGAARLGPRG